MHSPEEIVPARNSDTTNQFHHQVNGCAHHGHTIAPSNKPLHPTWHPAMSITPIKLSITLAMDDFIYYEIGVMPSLLTQSFYAPSMSKSIQQNWRFYHTQDVIFFTTICAQLGTCVQQMKRCASNWNSNPICPPISDN